MPATREHVEIAGLTVEITSLGKGPPLLFLHAGEGPDYTSPFLEQLARDFHVIAPSHPGFGHSSLPDDVKRVDDIAYLYLDLLRTRDLTDVTLVGASFGGWVAAEIAIRDTSRLRAVSLLAPLGARFSDDPSVTEIADIYMLPENEVIARSFADVRGRKLNVDALTDDDLVVLSRNRLALCQYAWSPYMRNPALRRWLHRIDVPCEILRGSHDRITAPDYHREWVQRIVGARMRIVEGAGHYPHLERAEETARIVTNFAKAAKQGGRA